jgi:molybdopterin molybdotransferase
MTRPPLLSLDDALPQLLAQAHVLTTTQSLSTFDADGRVLARDVVADLQVPPCCA